MSVDFSSTYSANSVSSNKPADIQTLQDAFAAALRSSSSGQVSTEKNTAQTASLLDVIQSSSSSNGKSNEDRQQQRRENQEQIDRTDYSQHNRKLQNKQELRSGDLDADYQNHLDRKNDFRNNYHEKTLLREQQKNENKSAENFQPPKEFSTEKMVDSTNRQPEKTSMPMPQTSGGMNPNISLSAIVGQTTSQYEANLTFSISTVTSPTVPALTVPVSPSVFSIFTLTGKFGKIQEKGEEGESDEEKEDLPEELQEKKKHPFADLTAIHTKPIRPLHRRFSPLPQETAKNPDSPQHREKPAKFEPIPIQNDQALKEFLNTSNVSVTKSGENKQPDRTEFFQRIAAACEAAANDSPIRMKLNLDHLGTLTLRLTKTNRLSLRFETPSAKSAHFLNESLEELKAILLDRHVQLDSVEVIHG